MTDRSLAKVQEPYPYSNLEVKTVVAVRHVRKMRGGSQSHLMFCSDGEYYVVKFQNNPQHIRVLANELLASLVVRPLNLPMPEAVIVEVDASLVRESPGMTINCSGRMFPCHSGLEFGSRYVVKPTEGQVFDYLPEELLVSSLRNPEQFAGVLTMDKWLCNSDGRQAAFWKRSREHKYKAAFIDQGHCFNLGEWAFPDNPLHGIYWKNAVYAGVISWASFEPWLSCIENTLRSSVLDAAGAIPPAWSEDDWSALRGLALQLVDRTLKVRELITAFRLSSRQPFPNWDH